MRKSEGTEALVRLEDDAPDLLFETVPGLSIPVWSYLRISLAWATRETELASPALRRGMTKGEALSHLAAACLPDRHSYRRMPRKGVLFFVGGGTIGSTPDGPRNWLVGEFAEATAPDSAILQIQPIPRSRRGSGSPVFDYTYSFDQAMVRAEIRYRTKPPSDRLVGAVRERVQTIVAAFPYAIDPAQLDVIERDVLKRIARDNYLDAKFAHVLDRVRPWIVIMGNASYGQYGLLIHRMKERGILVVEPQHGWVGPSHPAYNFGAAMSRPPLSMTLPDYFMTFGDYWSSSVRHPAKVVSVGKPHIESMASDAPPLRQRPRSVLVASSVSEPGEMVRFTRAIRDALPKDWGVVFRPHPSERGIVRDRYQGLFDHPGIALDENLDVYDSLKQVQGVVGVASTVLFEALAMGCHVFVKESRLAPYYMDDFFGERLQTPDSFAAFAATVTGGTLPSRLEERIDSIWKPRAVQNFLECLKEWKSLSG